MADVDLPVMPPLQPMLAKAAKAVPGEGYSHEPKWDGFRALIFRDGDEVFIGSRSGKDLGRYFPEVVAAARAVRATHSTYPTWSPASNMSQAPFATIDGIRMSRYRMFFSDRKARAELGYKARPYREGLSDAIAWFRQEGRL